MSSVGVLVVSKGRESIKSTLKSICKELNESDQVLLVLDGCVSSGCFKKYSDKLKIIKESKHGYWGHPLREKYQSSFTTDYIINVDDDDVLNPGWRGMVDLYLKREKVDLIIFNYINGYTLKPVMRINGSSDPLTGNVLFKNVKEIVEEKWGNFMGADKDRVNRLILKGCKVRYSDFPIMIKN